MSKRDRVRVALGLVQDTSNNARGIRGGDTSVFTLPSDSSTTESHHPTAATYGNSNNQRPVHLCRTVEILALILQRMSAACDKLLQIASADSIRATEDIKRSYLQLMSIPHKDLVALKQVFVERPNSTAIAPSRYPFQLPVSSGIDYHNITYNNTNKEEAYQEQQMPRMQELTLIPSAEEDLFTQQALETMEHDRYYNHQGVVFSPTLPGLDDLRRDIGSYDRDEDVLWRDECRDPPEGEYFNERDGAAE